MVELRSQLDHLTGANMVSLFVYVAREDDNTNINFAGKDDLLKWLKGCSDPRCVLVYPNNSKGLIKPMGRLITLVEAAVKMTCIPMVERPSLKEWIHPSGRLLCIGEAAHPIGVSPNRVLPRPNAQYCLPFASPALSTR